MWSGLIIFAVGQDFKNKLILLPTISKRQLSLHNGVDKKAIWIAYKGLVYDVSESRLWQNGKHYEHWAGQDLTNELSAAPHTEKVFERFLCIGILSSH